MAVYKRGSRWYYSFMIRYQRYRAVIPEAQTKREAERVETQARQAVFDGKYVRVEQGQKLGEFVERTYLPYARLNKRSHYDDKLITRVLCEFFAGKTFEQITPMLVEKYKKERREGLTNRGSQRRPATVNRELAVLSKIFSLAVDAGVAVSNPCLRVRKLRQDNERTRYLSYEEEARLMEALAAEDQLKRIVTLAINTGMRRGEIFNLCWPDVDFSRGVIYVRHTKTGKDRAVPMNVTGRAALEEQRRTAEHVFVSPRTGGPYVDIKRAFTAALRKAGIEDFRFHDLRHTAATRLADTGADAFTIAEILGHSSLAMTKRYTHATDEAKRRAVERLAEKTSSCLNFASKQIRQAG